jgi:AcrR family transcriptional regulator
VSRVLLSFLASLGRQTDKRAAIEASVLEATEALLSEGATYAELNIEKIATRAGISRTAFYFYFRDKRDLLVRLTSDVTDLWLEAAEGWWSGSSDLRSALTRIATLWSEHEALLRAVVEVSTYDEEVAVYWRGLVGRFVDATRDRIVADQATGKALPGDAAAQAFALVWMVERSVYEQQVADVGIELPVLVETMAQVFDRTVYGAPSA